MAYQDAPWLRYYFRLSEYWNSARCSSVGWVVFAEHSTNLLVVEEREPVNHWPAVKLLVKCSCAHQVCLKVEHPKIQWSSRSVLQYDFLKIWIFGWFVSLSSRHPHSFNSYWQPDRIYVHRFTLDSCCFSWDTMCEVANCWECTHFPVPSILCPIFWWVVGPAPATARGFFIFGFSLEHDATGTLQQIVCH